MDRKSLRRKKVFIESQLSANMAEVAYIKSYKVPDWKVLDSYYIIGRALAAQHMEILNQLDWR